MSHTQNIVYSSVKLRILTHKPIIIPMIMQQSEYYNLRQLPCQNTLAMKLGLKIDDKLSTVFGKVISILTSNLNTKNKTLHHFITSNNFDIIRLSEGNAYLTKFSTEEKLY